MALKIYNTISREKEEFKPLNDGKVSMYVCGPTVYGMPHLGHAKSYISFDVVYRYLKFLGYKVKYVQNITDVGHLVGDADEGESKIEKQAKVEEIDPYQVAYKYELEYFDTMEKLNVLKPDISCRATGHIIEIIDMVKTLVDKGYAYVTEQNNVYFDVSKFSDYGKLSHRSTDETISGERISIASDKKKPEDFALWKSADALHLMKWPSPWGEGYPGWHIECSVMSKKYLGDTFDIHGGGMDNMFPHHECEVAQSECANGKPFVKYFMHNNLVTVKGKKMGKSLGNYVSLNELFEKYDPLVIRFNILLTHYRRPTDFDIDLIENANKSYLSICESVNKCRKVNNKEFNMSSEVNEIKNKFLEALDDDFNTSLAISYIYELCKLINKSDNEDLLLSALNFIDNVVEPILGLSFSYKNETNMKEEDNLINYIIELRKKFRDEKMFNISDEIRDKLLEYSIEIKDTREGTTFKRINN